MSDRLSALLSFYEKDPHDSFTKYGIALEYLSRGDTTKAEKFFKLIIDKDPDYVPVYMQFAKLKEDQNKLDDARKYYRIGIEKAKLKGDKHAAKEMEDFLDDLG